MLGIYKTLLRHSAPLLEWLLQNRQERGKELADRLDERKGLAHQARPDGSLIWVHGASVGEAQSVLSLINRILQHDKNVHILVTTGTVTSAQLMAKTLPERAFHQFYPLDHPDWVERFLEHWRPDLILWVESELWPNMISAVKNRNVPAYLINARMSARSFSRWRLIKGSCSALLGAFHGIFAQTEDDVRRYQKLGGKNVELAGNIKYNAKPLPADEKQLAAIRGGLLSRPVWLYASSHKGEEELVCRVHATLKNRFPDLLSIIVPRHPHRGEEIAKMCELDYGFSTQLRGEGKALPAFNTDIYIANTLGELGLFYRLSPVAVIGRSFSDDGGGGHNPIEAAQLNCVVLHGPRVQYQKEIYSEMNAEQAAIRVKDEEALTAQLLLFLRDSDALQQQQKKGLSFAQNKAGVLEIIMAKLESELTNLQMRGDNHGV